MKPLYKSATNNNTIPVAYAVVNKYLMHITLCQRHTTPQFLPRKHTLTNPLFCDKTKTITWLPDLSSLSLKNSISIQMRYSIQYQTPPIHLQNTKPNSLQTQSRRDIAEIEMK